MQLTPPEALRVGAANLHLVPTVTGLASEGPRVHALLTQLRPSLVALGVSPDEVDALRHYRPDPADDRGEETIEEAEYDPGYAAGLHQFGDIELPPPDLLAAVHWADAAPARLEGVDLPQHEYDLALARNVGTLELILHGNRTRRLGKRPPKAATAHDFVIAWDRELLRSKGLARVEAMREAHMAERIRALSVAGGVVVALLPAPRVAGVRALLSGP